MIVNIYQWQCNEKEKENNDHIDAIESLILVNEIENENVNSKIHERPTSPEESIYETVTDHLKSQISENESNLNFTYSPSEKKVNNSDQTYIFLNQLIFSCDIQSSVLLEMMQHRYQLK